MKKRQEAYISFFTFVLVELNKKLALICLFSWQNDPVIPAFPDLHLSPAAILKELSMYFQKFSSQARLLTLPAPHELPPREAQEYPFFSFVIYMHVCVCVWLNSPMDAYLLLFY